MKKIYNAPEAGLLCFAPVEALATDFTFSDLIKVETLGGNQGNTVNTSNRDIRIDV